MTLILEIKNSVLGERTAEGFYRVKNGIEQAISRGLAYAPYADLVWCETGVPDLDFAKQFAEALKSTLNNYLHIIVLLHSIGRKS